MKRCTKCIMPETKPGIWFDDQDVCNACRNTETMESVDWKAQSRELAKLAQSVRKQKPQGYNCIIPVSGGKDSLVQAFTARDTLDLNPLCVCVEPCYPTELGKRNLRNLSRLGFDVFIFRPNQRIMPALLRRSYVEDGQPARAFEFMLYSVPMQVAINFSTPLVIWGEDTQYLYGNSNISMLSNAAYQRNLPALAGKDASHWLGSGMTERDLIAFQHPTAEELKAAGVKAIYLSHYEKWDSHVNAAFAIARGLQVRPYGTVWRSGGYWDFEQLDDEIPVVSHLLKYYKFGYGRATDQACRDIRWGYLTRENALEKARKYDGYCTPEYTQRFAEYIGMTWDEFWKVAESFRNLSIWGRGEDGNWQNILWENG